MQVDKKRILEIISSVISIVFGGLLILGSLVILANISEFAQGNNLGSEKTVLIAVVFDILIAAGLIVLGSLLCTSPMRKDGLPKNRVGLKIAFIVLNAVVAVLELLGSSILYFVVFLIPVVLEIVSMFL